MAALASKVTGRSYRLLAALAQGGMGEVFIGEALGEQGAAPVAIKTLLPEVARDTSMLNRFLDEARISARLDHPNIARLLDFGEAAGRPFAVFELLQGADLADCLDQLIERGEEMPVEVALAATIDACAGLEHAHTVKKDGRALGVVHRDLSPSNLFLTRDGQVKVLDFGAAWGRDRITRTATGMIIGKLEYMAPEQVKGEPVDARTDVFALGLCLHESLTLKRPYATHNERELVRKIFAADVPPLEQERPGLPRALYEAVRRATWPGKDDRFSSAWELSASLAPILAATTHESPREILRQFFARCFPPERVAQRDARLQSLRALPMRNGPEPFEWSAPSLREEAAAIPVTSGRIQVVDSEPTTKPDAPFIREPATRKLDPPSRRNSAAPQRSSMLGYLVAGGVVLAAIAAGLLLGHVGATLGH